MVEQDLVRMRRQIECLQVKLYKHEQVLKNKHRFKDDVESRNEGKKGAGT